ncbi:cell cycle arrest protein [Suhomyces tanzawaensis NRRL Y-17324]|uniref:Cell cycle arrest protein n=1 Tax=Suhomyces tanzawaensis NRRL Y-17324 TaxID=984487 RepID=A0A1E4SH35_9ASCO|nr:cell cycle arrest protein [Suhomyces tanzawaensis NRRL Y-17324]ODV78818.1 cell cycle arrest protein [Suhomyces tanzawaensis NRRL Y-17324]
MSQFIELPSPHALDIVSDLKVAPTHQLIVTSWDNKVLLYDVSCAKAGKVDLQAVLESSETPLSLVFTGGSAFVGCLDGTINQIDQENMKLHPIYTPGPLGPDSDISNGINKICRVESDENALIASSFNGTFRVLDIRQHQEVSRTRVGSDAGVGAARPAKIFTMDSSRDVLTVGLSTNHIELYDLRNLTKPYERRELGLKYQIKDLKCLPDNQGFVVSTVDGRVSLECYDLSPETQAAKRFTFKCHRSHNKIDGVDEVYPVNSLALAQDGTLYTSGGDGAVCVWDCNKRKRIKMYPKFSESVAKIALQDDLLAVATSDDDFVRARRLSDPINTRVPSKVFVRVVE